MILSDVNIEFDSSAIDVDILTFNPINDTTLDVTFDSICLNVSTIIIGVNQIGIYRTNILTNVSTVAYKVNTIVQTLPFTVIDSDILEITITRTVPSNDSVVELKGTF